MKLRDAEGDAARALDLHVERARGGALDRDRALAFRDACARLASQIAAEVSQHGLDVVLCVREGERGAIFGRVARPVEPAKSALAERVRPRQVGVKA
jgi:hypothetical protein